jgi:hypothetical protein
MPRRSNVLRSWRGGRNEPSFRFSAALPYLLRGSWGRSCLCELPAMGRSRKALLLPWPDALKHTRSQILVYACISRHSADTCVAITSRAPNDGHGADFAGLWVSLLFQRHKVKN